MWLTVLIDMLQELVFFFAGALAVYEIARKIPELIDYLKGD